MSEMRRARITLAALAAAGLAVAGSASGSVGPAPANDRPLTTGRALIDVRTPRLPVGDDLATEQKRDSRLARSDELLSRVSDRQDIDVEARSVPAGLLAANLDGTSLEDLRAKLETDPLVKSVITEPRAEYRYVPNDPAFGSLDQHAPGGDFFQWPLFMQSFPKAWDLTRGFGAEVAVIDSGAYVSHPDLAGRISGTLDCSGVGCFGGNVTDTEGHGTHVSGLACASGDNGYGIASGGFYCSLYVIKTDLSFTSIINSIYAATAHGADAINMSFGGSSNNSNLRDAVDYAWGTGAVPVVAGTNIPDPGSDYPAQYVQPPGSGPNIDAGEGLVVTSVSHTGLRSFFAQRNNGVSVAGVGSATDILSGGEQGIISTWPPPVVSGDQYGVRTGLFGDNRFAYLVGTSMSAPQVAGLVALMRTAKPTLSSQRLVRLAKLTALNCGQYGSGVGWGLIQAGRAVGAALDRDADSPSSQITRARRVRGGNVSLRLKSSDAACSRELPASGVRVIRVFASANGGFYRRVAKTKRAQVRFRAKPGRRYRFYSVAVDQAGNVEDAPLKADAKLRLKKRKR